MGDGLTDIQVVDGHISPAISPRPPSSVASTGTPGRSLASPVGVSPVNYNRDSRNKLATLDEENEALGEGAILPADRASEIERRNQKSSLSQTSRSLQSTKQVIVLKI